MKDLYLKKGVLEKAFKEIASKQDSRPALKCLHIAENGSAVVTDSHVLLKVNDYLPASSLAAPLNIDLTSFTPVSDVHYPDTDRLIPDHLSDDFTLCKSDLQKVYTYLKGVTIKTRVGESQILTITALKNELLFECSGTEFHLVLTDFNSHVGQKIIFTPQYLIKVIEFLSHVYDNRRNSDSLPVARVTVTGKNSPVLFSVSDSVQLLVPPRRAF
jgi:hypothetical protein